MSILEEFDSQKKSLGDIKHFDHLSKNLESLFLNPEYSDVVFVVDNIKFPVHRVILASRSEYFRALLYGGMCETHQDEIVLKKTPLVSFKILLKYIYTGSINLKSCTEDEILEILSLTHQYGFEELELEICNYLKLCLTVKNVCDIYDVANLYQKSDLEAACIFYIDVHAAQILKQENSLNLSLNALCDIISRDSFYAPESLIFQTVHQWIKQNPEIDPELILNKIRLPLISIYDLLNIVRPTGLIQPDKILDAIQVQTESRTTDLKYRGYLKVGENMALNCHGATVIQGDMRDPLLDGDIKHYNMERGFTRHPIDYIPEHGIVIQLGMPCIINNIRMLLWDRDARSWQDLHFPARVVQYIRIVGTHNTVNRVFHVVSLEAKFVLDSISLQGDLIIPKVNVASVAMKATVIEGVCRNRNSLLDGDTKHYDWDSGYICHQLGSGSIVVQLAQPYIIGSICLLLWDCDDRRYSYYIETSVDQKDWQMAVDRTQQLCQSWQHLTFSLRPVVFIRIIGTRNTANEVFHCVHLECPVLSHIPIAKSELSKQKIKNSI